MEKTFTVRGARNWASSFLEEHNREARVGELMLLHLLDAKKHQILMRQTEELPEGVSHTFQKWVQEHAETGKPLEHFTKKAEFYGRDFYVDHRVLIPRPETEELIEAVLSRISPNMSIVDVGTGSGIIGITLKSELPETKVYATDLSEDALEVAQENANALESEVHFYKGNFLEPLLEQKINPDIIVSNPPYIPVNNRSNLSNTVLHDPELALFAEKDGLAAYEAIANQALQLDEKPQLIAFEIGHDQGESVPALLNKLDPNAHLTVIQDINKKDRIVLWK
ncbi:peptide chain release factor N(5)-glutamine methyltransferase [Halalkalibacillus halophilus]|uniref:peptide chain release factor N(5)-glutamine methyltransferase n=1 Tax=Halalkalibacillus halophilus TaxID=392827 RepID=UPI00040AC992|nr:peptide chain release factor N(5)-glutamine methyltransferase [Halalkalibacillus halophilus]